MGERYRADLVDAFEDVKESVRRTEGLSRAGLMLGLQELGSSPGGFIGGYYTLYSNLIVMNQTSLRRILETDPSLMRPYSYHVLLHEYIHSLGFFDEDTTRRKTYDVTRTTFGEGHTATRMACDMKPYFPNLVYPSIGFSSDCAPIELVEGFDHGNYRQYIS